MEGFSPKIEVLDGPLTQELGDYLEGRDTGSWGTLQPSSLAGASLQAGALVASSSTLAGVGGGNFYGNEPRGSAGSSSYGSSTTYGYPASSTVQSGAAKMSFHDDGEVYSRIEAMRVAKEQAKLRVGKVHVPSTSSTALDSWHQGSRVKSQEFS